MRAARLISLLLIVQQRGKVTAAEVADALEVSERTARRDLEALAMSGVPLYSTAGRGGGWQLIGGASTDLTGLSSPESQAIFAAIGASAADSPLLQSALSKLATALPHTFRSNAIAASQAIRIDNGGWGEVVEPQSTQWLDELLDATISGHQVEIDYFSPHSSARTRVVHPLGIVSKRDRWYLVANTNDGFRTFRLSRMSAVTPLDAPVIRPDGFDLDAHWKHIVAEVEALRVGIEVTACVAPDILEAVRWVFGTNCTYVSTTSEQFVEVRIGARDVNSLAGKLAGFGGAIELLHPPAILKDRMAQIGTELTAAYET